MFTTHDGYYAGRRGSRLHAHEFDARLAEPDQLRDVLLTMTRGSANDADHAADARVMQTIEPTGGRGWCGNDQ
jgi:hypothetical protein